MPFLPSPSMHFHYPLPSVDGNNLSLVDASHSVENLCFLHVMFCHVRVWCWTIMTMFILSPNSGTNRSWHAIKKKKNLFSKALWINVITVSFEIILWNTRSHIAYSCSQYLCFGFFSLPVIHCIVHFPFSLPIGYLCSIINHDHFVFFCFFHISEWFWCFYWDVK